MTDLRFERNNLNSKLLHGDLGEAFQSFVYELLVHDYPGIHLFPGGVKDGGIDLSGEREDSRVFVECKYIGSDALSASLSRWREMAKHLDKHLADPAQPSVGQRQYLPWYRTRPPVAEYIFCISALLANRDQLDRLQEEIKGFFAKLSSEHNHLAHLASISVRVLDWSDLRSYLIRYPQILLRWFPRTRPVGLIPIDDFSEIGSFRSYLYGDLLPYYARHNHLQLVPAPRDSVIPDEEGLLRELAGTDIVGLIITGKGGVGKTRLTLEVGRLARRKGWLVLRCRGNLSADTIIQLAEIISPDQQVLIVADYIEVQREFNEFVETLIALNETYDLRVRYVANCRTSYYRSLTTLPSQKELNLSPSLRGSEVLWVKSFQKRVVRHILESSHLAVTSEHLQICRNRPVFAVFMSYLHRSNRGEELTELLGEKDFSSWVAKRLQLTFGEAATTRRLALLMVLFPLSDKSLHHYDLLDSVAIIERLAADGWIERPSLVETDGQKSWAVAHDVLADQIVLSYLHSIADTVELFIQDALAAAARVGTFRSALVTMQRLADQSPLEDVDWFKILVLHISEQPGVPLLHDFAALLRTSLLTPLERIKLLGANEDYWMGAEAQADFQTAIGWLARWAQREGRAPIDGEDRVTLMLWLGRAGRLAAESNYVLSSGLRFCSEVVRDAAFNWISTRPFELQTHYLIVAWLESDLPPSDIELPLWQWTTHFMFTRQLSFVAAAWLESGGDYTLISEHVVAWLEEFGKQPEAHFIYRAWLDARGDLEPIQDRLNGWLAQNAGGPGAASIYVSWLRRGDPPNGLSPYIPTWLTVHGEKAEAGSIYRMWLIKGGDIQVVAEHLRRWLYLWETDRKAEPVYSAWLRVGGELEVVSDQIKAWLSVNDNEIRAAFIYHAWLRRGGDKNWVKPLVARWIQDHSTEPVAERVYTAWLFAYGGHESIVTPILAWLEKHAEAQEADYVLKAWLRTGGEFSIISPHVITWLEANWDSVELREFARFILHRDPPLLDAIETIIRLCITKPDSKNSLRCLLAIIAARWNSANYQEIIETVLRFCVSRPNSDISLRCLAEIISHPRDSATHDAACVACALVLDNVVSIQEVYPKAHRGRILQLLSALLTSPQFSSGERREQINGLLVRWINNPSSFTGNVMSVHKARTPEYFHRIRELVATGSLVTDRDRRALKRVLRWINTWPAETKSQLRDDLGFLSLNYPAPDLWDSVAFESKKQPEEEQIDPSLNSS
jgi:hypothetical protein